MAATTRRKTKGTATEAFQNRKAWGTEPSLPDHELTQLEIQKCLTWYNYVESRSDAHAYLVEYLKAANDERWKAIKRAAEKHVSPTAGWLARMLSRGAILPAQTQATFERLVNESAQSRNSVEETDEQDKNIIEIKPTIQQRMAEKAGDMIADIEDVLDKWLENKDFSAYDYFKSKEAAPKIVSQVISYYEPLLSELNAKDPQVNEAYRHLGRNKSVYTKFVASIIAEAERFVGVSKAAKPRKPRAKKKQTPEQKFKHLRYLKDSAAFQIKSIDPTAILGAMELWAFDTKSQRMTLFVAASDKGLDIKRSSVVGFDDKKSVSKTVGRKAQQMIDSVLRGTKTQAKKALEKITAKAAPPHTDRTNDNMVFLKVFK